MTSCNSLTTKDVARLCRVSDATVKRWEQAGLIRSEKTNGGHRRFRADEIARFQREARLGLKSTVADPSVNTTLARRRKRKDNANFTLFEALVEGSEEDAAALIINDFVNGKPLPKIFDDAVSTSMCRIGELWAEGEMTVAQEHLATRAVLFAIHKLRGTLPVPELKGKFVMCCAIEGDFHELPTHLAQIIFESQGFEVINFGANTPLHSFAEEVIRYSPALACISGTLINNTERLQRDYGAFRDRIAKTKCAVVLGGRGFEDENLKRKFPSEFYAQTFTKLAIFSEGF